MSTSIPTLSIPVLSAIAGGLLVALLFADYFRRKRVEVATLAAAPPPAAAKAPKPNPAADRRAANQRSQAANKEQHKRHHPLDVNTLKGHGDVVTALCFSSDSQNLATACGDGGVRVFRLDDASAKSFKCLKMNLPAGAHPTAIAFAEGSSSVAVAAQNLMSSSLYMYGDVIIAKPSGEGKTEGKLPVAEIKWEHSKVHDKSSVRTLVAAAATYGSGDGSTILASCSEETDIKLWHGKTGKYLGIVDTNQLKNHMATISPNGRFLAAAAFTADVKVWEIIYSKDGSVKDVLRVMQLKGHKSAVTCLCFTPNSEHIITASKDGSIRIWNINVRYHLDEDPKTLKVFPLPLKDGKGATSHYDHMSISPDGKILAATCGSTLQWLCAENGKVLDTAEDSHDGDITGIAWAPSSVPLGTGVAMILATSSVDKKSEIVVCSCTPEVTPEVTHQNHPPHKSLPVLQDVEVLLDPPGPWS